MASSSPRLNLDQLLHMGAAAARKGNRAAARALFLALTREYPHDPRVWGGLAQVATSTAERRAALEEWLALDPDNQQALSGLAQLTADEAPAPDDRSTQLLPETILAQVDVDAPAPAAPVADDELSEAPRFPLLNAIGMAIILALLAAVGLLVGRALLANSPSRSPTPILHVQASPAPAFTADATLPAGAALPTAVATIETTLPAAPSAPATPAPSAAPTIAAAESLPLGSLVSVDGWSTTLLRPDYALLLDGALGNLQPNGRFVVTLLAVSNNTPTPRYIPTDLFALTDGQGRRYSPVPGASSAYLAVCGRGHCADLALDEEIEPLSGMRTVPVLFDVPADAANLALIIPLAGNSGWSISGSAPDVPAGP